jgi:hypothetical protein
LKRSHLATLVAKITVASTFVGKKLLDLIQVRPFVRIADEMYLAEKHVQMHSQKVFEIIAN